MMSEKQASVLKEIVALHPLPADCLFLDVETTGLSTERDLVVDIGYVDVRGGVIYESANMLLDWSKVLSRPELEELYVRLAATAQTMQFKGRRYPYTWEMLERGGDDPKEVFVKLHAIIKDSSERGGCQGGHNFINFDSKWLDAHWRWLNADDQAKLPWSNFVDTGLLEKAIQLGRVPNPGEPILAWYQRVANERASGVFWNLSEHCSEKYDLGGKFGFFGADWHDARYDCMGANYLLKVYADAAGTPLFTAVPQRRLLDVS